ncbi:MAG: hypothetical protein LBR27_02630 [Bifidobacteriaceae bacterium]|nr:hypothetical protein [Bifidobacteriaceae bacterium]
MKRWQLVRGHGAVSPVERDVERAKLTPREAAGLDSLKDRIAWGEATAADVAHIQGYPLLEARLKTRDRLFRLLYVEEAGTRPVLLALLFTPKKSGKLPPSVFETAVARLKVHREIVSALPRLSLICDTDRDDGGIR